MTFAQSSISGVPRETVADTTLRFRKTRAAYTREAEPAKRPRPTSELLIVKEIEAVESTAILVVGPSSRGDRGGRIHGNSGRWSSVVRRPNEEVEVGLGHLFYDDIHEITVEWGNRHTGRRLTITSSVQFRPPRQAQGEGMGCDH
jgi:hypothetical protein